MKLKLMKGTRDIGYRKQGVAMLQGSGETGPFLCSMEAPVLEREQILKNEETLTVFWA